MKAIVCDKCGKVVLLEEDKPFAWSSVGVYTIRKDNADTMIELCEDCGNELIAAVREQKGGLYLIWKQILEV